MSVEYSNAIEKRKMKETIKAKWDLYTGTSLVMAVRTARDLGWEDKKVQVRYEETPNGLVYYVEPYEKGCGCRGLLRFRDFFG